MVLSLTAVSPFIHTRPVMALFRDTHAPADLRAASRRAFRRAIVDSVETFAAIGAPGPVLRPRVCGRAGGGPESEAPRR